MTLAAEVHEEGRLPVRQVHGQRRAPDGRRRTPTRARPRPRSPRRSSRSSASRSSSARSRRTRSTPSTARCPSQEGRDLRRAGWFKDFADPQSMLEPTFNGTNIVTTAATTTSPSSTTRRSTRRWTRPRCSQGDARIEAWARHRQDDHRGRARPSRSSGTRRTLIWSKDVNGVGNAYYDALRLRVHVAEVGDRRIRAGPAAPRRGGPRPAARPSTAMAAYIIRRLLWTVFLLLVVSAHHVRDLLRAAVAPTRRALRAGSSADAGARSRRSASSSGSTSRCTSSSATT